MVYPSTPVEVGPIFSSVIASVMGAYAKAQGLVFIPWYHDEPIWFIKQQDGDLVRRVQVSAFRRDEGGQQVVSISIIPDAYKVVGNRVATRIDQQAIQGSIQTVSTYRKSPDEMEKELPGALAKAWEAAKKLAM